MKKCLMIPSRRINLNKSIGRDCFAVCVHCCDLFSAFISDSNLGRRNTYSCPSALTHWRRESVRVCVCVWKRVLYVLACEREREVVFAMLPSFLITSVSWYWPFLCLSASRSLSGCCCNTISLFFPTGLRLLHPSSSLCCMKIIFRSKTVHVLHCPRLI